MNFGSTFSGIEAASVAWRGWNPVFYSEIEKFPCAVLAHHHPAVPNLGDVRNYKEWPDATLDVLVGGSPCQSFSVAGLRKGLADPRGNLSLTFLGVADRYRPRWLLWENVPGVLSQDGGRAFGSILGGMAELGYHGSYRVLDAQYIRVDGFGRAVPQRRRRVFVVGHLGDWRRAAAVLFEPESLSGNFAPRRQTGERIAPTISARPTGGGGLGTDFDLDGALIAFSGNDTSGPIDVATARNAHAGPHGRLDFESETFVAHLPRAGSFDASEDGTGRGTPLVSVAFNITPSNSNKDYKAREASYAQAVTTQGGAPSARGGDVVAVQERAICENPDAWPDGAGVRDDGAAYTIEARTVPQAVQFGWAVRRLTPTECERLQGFPDGYTNIPWRGKDCAPDGPRYKALGNSMAVNVMRWIGRRVQMVEDMKIPLQQAS